MDDDVDLGSAWAFGGTQCASTFCGVSWGGCDIPSNGNVMANGKIRIAVAAWLSDATAAEATYGHISTWETGGVTDMDNLFEDASSFNEDIGAWDTSGVTRMFGMFEDASAFDQDLGWCMDDDVRLGAGAFYNTPCEATSCGVKQRQFETEDGSCGTTPAPTISPLAADDSTIRTAVTAWLADPTAAETTYGHISTWETGGVTDMGYLFCGSTDYWAYSSCDRAAASFNEDIGAWDTSGVTTMYDMFWGCLLYTSPSPRDGLLSRMPSSA